MESKSIKHPYILSIKPISMETIKAEMHSQAITADGTCCTCGLKYSPLHIFSRAGWEDTKRTGICQQCTQEQSSLDDAICDEDSDPYENETQTNQLYYESENLNEFS